MKKILMAVLLLSLSGCIVNNYPASDSTGESNTDENDQPLVCDCPEVDEQDCAVAAYEEMLFEDGADVNRYDYIVSTYGLKDLGVPLETDRVEFLSNETVYGLSFSAKTNLYSNQTLRAYAKHVWDLTQGISEIAVYDEEAGTLYSFLDAMHDHPVYAGYDEYRWCYKYDGTNYQVNITFDSENIILEIVQVGY
ncbi:MAG: hypothetical protein LBR25_09295 [Erysipelotrichaceae bacterium]|jgi:hypothetical protein|nr:hypothetical protein [Erysipelotrichaceae bacterium]